MTFSGAARDGEGLHAGRPALRLLLREPYTAGLYEVDRVQLWVNRGVGNVGIALRVNAPPEVSLLTLRSAEVVGSAPRDG